MRKFTIFLLVILITSFAFGELQVSYNSNQPKVVIGACTDFACRNAINNFTEPNYFEYLCIGLDCINDINGTIENATKTIIYLPQELATEIGTVDAGNLASIQGIFDFDYYNVSEVTGSPAIQIFINFTEVEDFNEGVIVEWYQGGSGHIIDIGVWNYNTGVWDENWASITDQTDFTIVTGTVFGAENYIGTGDDEGIVQVRLNHADSGNINHDFSIDYIALRDGFTSLTTSDHDALSNRNNQSNHDWAMDIYATRAFLDDVNFSNNNLTDVAGILFNEDASIIIGTDINVNSETATCIGETTTCLDEQSVGIGYLTYVDGQDATGIGSNAGASGDYAVGIGSNALSSADYAVAIGSTNFATRKGCVSIGSSTICNGNWSLSIGYSATVDTDAMRGIAIGYLAQVEGYNNDSIAIGSNAYTDANNSMVLGANTKLYDDNTAVINYSTVYIDGNITLPAGSIKSNATCINVSASTASWTIC